MRNAAIIQARMSSSRLPGKVLMNLGSQPVLAWCVRAARAIPGLDGVAVATSVETGDDAVAAWCQREGILCIRGSLTDVLGRYVSAARQLQADTLMRLTADCPLLDPEVCGQVLKAVHETGADYANNTSPRSWPHGLDCEAFTADALYTADTHADTPYDREHVTPYIYMHPDRFRLANVPCPVPGLSTERWTLDYPQDYAFLARLAPHLPEGRPPGYREVLDVLERNLQLKEREPIP